MAARKKLDVNQLGAFIVGEATGGHAAGVSEKTVKATALGRKGGLKGGKARSEALSAPQRKAVARKAAKARWT